MRVSRLLACIAGFGLLAATAQAQVGADWTATTGGSIRPGYDVNACSASNRGAIRYSTTETQFQVCYGSGSWVALSDVSGTTPYYPDRITSGTAGIFVSNTGIINFRTAGTTFGYFDTSGLLVAPGISITTANGISSTFGYFANRVGIGTTVNNSDALTLGRSNAINEGAQLNFTRANNNNSQTWGLDVYGFDNNPFVRLINIASGTAPFVISSLNDSVGIGLPALSSPSTRLEVNGTISATNFVGNGSGLTNLSAGDRITSGTAGVYVSNTGIVSLLGSQVGINTTNPGTARVYINEPSINNTHALQATYQATMTADLSADRYAAWNQAKLTGAYNFTGGIYGSVNQVETDQTNTSNAGVMVGSYGAAYNYKKTVSSANGAQGRVTNAGTGTIASTNALYGIVANSGTGTITNAYGLGLDVVNQSTGAITNAYGLYLGSVQGTNKWSLYQSDSSAPNFFSAPVGLGRSNPGARLDVSATVELPIISRALRDSIGLRQVGTGSIYTDWYVSDAASGQKFWRAGNASGNFVLDTINDAYSTGTTRLKIDGSNGYVGIGTSTPSYGLDVQSGVGPDLRIKGSNPDSSVIRFENTSANGRIYHVGSTGSTSGAGQGFSIYDVTSGAPRFIINSSGNVGIGTTVPTAKLHIAGGNNSWIDGILLEQTGSGGRKYSFASRENGKLFIGDETANVARFVVDSSGNIGINNIYPNAKLDVVGDISGSSVLRLNSNKMNITNDGANASWVNNTGYSLFYNYVGSGSELAFRFHGKTNGTPLVDIYNNGVLYAPYVGVGTATPGSLIPGYGAHQVGIYNDGASDSFGIRHRAAGTAMNIWRDSASIGNGVFINFAYGNGSAPVVGTITTNGTSTAYNTTSDRRLKTDIHDTARGLDDLMKVQVRDFRFKADPSKTMVQGFIAQDLYQVYPEAVTVGGEDASKHPWNVDYGRMTPLVVKSIQDLKARNDHLEARVAELEALVARLTSGTQPTRH